MCKVSPAHVLVRVDDLPLFQTFHKFVCICEGKCPILRNFERYWPHGFQSFKSEKSNEGKRLKVSYLLPTAHSGHLKKFRNFEKESCFSYNQTCLIAYQTNDTKRETAPVPENLHALNEMYVNWKWLTLTFLELIIN